LKIGSYVEGRIVTGAGEALLVPVASVVQRDGIAYVFTVEGGKVARRVRVQTGATTDGRVEIVQGLKAGTRIVEQGAGFLGDGDVVRVVAAPAPGSTAPTSTKPTP
ncbi:MAG: efflux RND transporter periplasmic adaptor subunit, partial [Pseudoxanthomonas sp.]